MKSSTRPILRIALYTVLLSAPPILLADGGDPANLANMQPETHQTFASASAPEPLLRLTNDQLDSIVAGQVVERGIPGAITIPNLGTFAQIQPQTFMLIPVEGSAEATVIQLGNDQNVSNVQNISPVAAPTEDPTPTPPLVAVLVGELNLGVGELNIVNVNAFNTTDGESRVPAAEASRREPDAAPLPPPPTEGDSGSRGIAAQPIVSGQIR
jgi:hypothetical protein